MSLPSLSIEDIGEVNADLSFQSLFRPEKIGDPFRVVENEATLSKSLPGPLPGSVLMCSLIGMYLVPPLQSE
jgi:hypothetical protein